ncbi:hypothetical protein PR048_021185 [Dryococelus australis]|uniref:Uncharacterized protein n=1 Tax=Dryococelus australis TaxID=614101 RepID=A0ABQ9GXI3_9NEOP|nr:hypothetical protein PR048_021185 [Dryococelus australis]
MEVAVVIESFSVISASVPGGRLSFHSGFHRFPLKIIIGVCPDPGRSHTRQRTHSHHVQPASRQDELGSIPCRFTLGFRKWGSCRTMPLVGGFPRRSPRFTRLCIPMPLRSHLISPSSALKTSLLRAARISQLNCSVASFLLNFFSIDTSIVELFQCISSTAESRRQCTGVCRQRAVLLKWLMEAIKSTTPVLLLTEVDMTHLRRRAPISKTTVMSFRKVCKHMFRVVEEQLENLSFIPLVHEANIESKISRMQWLDSVLENTPRGHYPRKVEEGSALPNSPPPCHPLSTLSPHTKKPSTTGSRIAVRVSLVAYIQASIISKMATNNAISGSRTSLIKLRIDYTKDPWVRPVGRVRPLSPLSLSHTHAHTHALSPSLAAISRELCPGQGKCGARSITRHRVVTPAELRTRNTRVVSAPRPRDSDLLLSGVNRSANPSTTGAVINGAGETGDPRENPPTSLIVRHDSHMRKSGSDPAGDWTRFTLT